MKRRRSVKPVPLPPPCSQCRPYDGAWRKDAYTGGMERCDCARGQALAGYRRGRPAKPVEPPKERKPGFDGRMASTGDE